MPQTPVPPSARGSAGLGGLPPAARASAGMGGFPAAGPVPSAARASFGTIPGPSPVRSSMPMNLNRGSMRQMPVALPDEVPLTPVSPGPADPMRSSIPGGWVPGDEKRGQFGTLGVICATILLMVLVFFGAKMLMN